MPARISDLEVFLDDVREDVRRIRGLGAAAHRLAVLALRAAAYEADPEFRAAVDAVLAFYGPAERPAEGRE